MGSDLIPSQLFCQRAFICVGFVIQRGPLIRKPALRYLAGNRGINQDFRCERQNGLKETEIAVGSSTLDVCFSIRCWTLDVRCSSFHRWWTLNPFTVPTGRRFKRAWWSPGRCGFISPYLCRDNGKVPKYRQISGSFACCCRTSP